MHLRNIKRVAEFALSMCKADRQIESHRYNAKMLSFYVNKCKSVDSMHTFLN